MYLSAYHFDGDPETLLDAHDRLAVQFPLDAFDLHLVVRGERGIVVLDACPSRAVFESFSTSPEFRAAVAAAGLPAPRIEPFGDVHTLALAHRLVAS